MKLTTLGGSAAGVGTGQGCSSYLLQSDAASMVLDLGPNTLLELRKHTDYRRLDGIVISHLHVDHILDLVALRFTLNYNPMAAPAPISLYLPPNGVAMLERIADAFEGPGTGIEWFTGVFDVQEYDPSASVTVNDLTCTFHPTVHFIPCWAIRIQDDEGTGGLLYTADTGPAADLVDFGKGSSVVVAEGAGLANDATPFEDRGHLTPEEAGDLATRIGTHTLVLTHLWEERDPAKSVQRVGNTFDGAVLRATPGLEVAWHR